jgi:hypothetical protein
VDQRGYWRRPIKRDRAELGKRPPASSERVVFWFASPRRLGYDHNSRWRPFRHHDHRSRRLHDDHCRRRIHDDDHIVDIVDGRCRTRTRPPDLAPASRQLDQRFVYNDCRIMEYRVGVQVCPCPGRRSVVSGVRDSGRVASHRNARD